MISLYGVYSHSNVASVGGLGVLGDGYIYGARIILPLPTLDQYSHSLTLGADYKHFKQSVLFGSDSSTTPIGYTPFSASYDATLQAPESVTQFSAGVNFSVRGLGNKQQEFESMRFGARADYFYLKAGVQHTHNLPAGLSLFAQLNGQAAGQPLITYEQFSAGGADSVRGYLQSEALGDSGLDASVELRSPQLMKSVSALKEFQMFGFLDGAHLHVNQALPGQQSSFSLSSAGFGLRMKTVRNLNAYLDVAWPLRDCCEITMAGDVRTDVRLWYEF
jgi:hemolysin activation/secretion protein